MQVAARQWFLRASIENHSHLNISSVFYHELQRVCLKLQINFNMYYNLHTFTFLHKWFILRFCSNQYCKRMQGSLKRIVYPKYPFTYIIIIKQHIPTFIAAKWIIKPGNYKFFVFCFAIILLIGIFLNLVRVMIEHKNLRDALSK